MKAMILAAGEGRRLLPLTRTVPKPMLEVGGAPFIAYLVDLVRSHDVVNIAINLHHRPEVIRAYLGDGSRFGVSITYSQEERLLGSAGAVKRLEQFFDESFFVLYGDVLTDVDLSALASFHREKGAGLTMAIYQAEDATRCGIVEVDEDGRARRFLEKPKRREVFSPWANAGVYVAEPDILRFIPGDSFFDFGADLIPILLQEGTPVYGYTSPSYFLDIGSLDRYQQAERDLAAGLVELGQSTSSTGHKKEKVASRR